MMQLIANPEGSINGISNLFIFIIIIVVIVFYIMILALYSERSLRIHAEKNAGVRILVGSSDGGNGRIEDYEFMIAETFPYDDFPEVVKKGIERSEVYQLEMTTETIDDEVDDDEKD